MCVFIHPLLACPFLCQECVSTRMHTIFYQTEDDWGEVFYVCACGWTLLTKKQQLNRTVIWVSTTVWITEPAPQAKKSPGSHPHHGVREYWRAGLPSMCRSWKWGNTSRIGARASSEPVQCDLKVSQIMYLMLSAILFIPVLINKIYDMMNYAKTWRLLYILFLTLLMHILFQTQSRSAAVYSAAVYCRSLK